VKVFVIGATGNTGRLVTPRLLARGYQVTAFARQPAKITPTGDGLRVVQGDVRDPAALESAVRGQDAVIAAFGPRTLAKTNVQEVFMRHLVTAVQHGRVRRLVNLSAWGAGGATVPPRSLFVRYFLLPILLRHLLDDKRRGEVPWR
jgi:putative NADH-flavin reductase